MEKNSKTAPRKDLTLNSLKKKKKPSKNKKHLSNPFASLSRKSLEKKSRKLLLDKDLMNLLAF